MNKIFELLEKLNDIDNLSQKEKVSLCEELYNKLIKTFECVWEEDCLFCKKDNLSISFFGYDGEYTYFKKVYEVHVELEYKLDGKWNMLNSIPEIIEHFKQSIKIINLTPHDLNLCDEEGNILETFESQGQARVKTFPKKLKTIGNYEVVKTSYGETEGLPEQTDKTFYVVSFIVLQANPARTDLIAPDTSPSGVIRNENGQIKGVKRFTTL